MKKIVIPILAVLSLLISFTVFADDIPTVYITDSQNSGTSDITVSISVTENTPFCGGSMNLVYDNTLMKAKSYEISELLTGYIANVNLNYADNTIRFSWAGTEAITAGGGLFTIVFEPVSSDSFETDIMIDKLKLADENGKKIEAVSEDGHIKYEKETSASTTTGGRSGRSSGASSRTTPEIEENKMDENKTETVKLSFLDVRESDWYYEYVKQAFEKGLMNGISETEFAPNEKLTRAMFVTILHRMDGEPEASASPFADVEKGSWYEKAVAWANANEIVQGFSETEFAPDANITREQMAAIIYRYANYKGIDTEAVMKDTNTLSHNDIFEVSDWAQEGMHYCIAAGIISGDENGNLLPKTNATRAETATVITRL